MEWTTCAEESEAAPSRASRDGAAFNRDVLPPSASGAPLDATHRHPLRRGRRRAAIRWPRDVVRDLSAKQNARGAHVVADVDEEQREVAHTPEQRREHDQPA